MQWIFQALDNCKTPCIGVLIAPPRKVYLVFILKMDLTHELMQSKKQKKKRNKRIEKK